MVFRYLRFVPADMRHFERPSGDVVRSRAQLDHLPRENAEPRTARRLLTGFEQHLKAHADAEVRPPRSHVLAHRLTDVAGKGPRVVAERALARHDELVGGADLPWVSRYNDGGAAPPSGLRGLGQRALHARPSV